MTMKKEAKFNEIVQSSMIISLFSGVDPKTKFFLNIPILLGGEGLITDHQARLKVEEAFGQLNLPDLFKTFDFTLHRASYEPYKLKEDLVISPYIYSVKAQHRDTFLMSLFLTPWADVNLSSFQEKIIEFTRAFSGIFRRTTEEIDTMNMPLEYRQNECERGGTMLIRYLSHLIFDQRQMLGGTEKVSKHTNLLAVLFQKGNIGKYFACMGKCGNSFSAEKFQDLAVCPNCGGQVSKKPIHLFDPKSVSIAFPDGFTIAEASVNPRMTIHKPIDFLYLFQSSYLPSEIRLTLNRIAEHVFTHIVPLPHRALFEYRNSDEILTIYSLSKLENDKILIISGIADSKIQVEGQLSQMALRIFIRDLNEGIKKGFSRDEIFHKSILKDWHLSSWVSLKGEGTPVPLMSWTNLKETCNLEE